MPLADGVHLVRMVCRPEVVLVRDGQVHAVDLPVEISVPSAQWPAWASDADGWPAQLASLEAELCAPENQE